MPPKQNIINRINDIESAINNLDFSSPDYTQELRGMWNEFRHIADDYLGSISSDLRKLNKNIIVAALIQSNTANPKKLLATCSDIADKFLEQEAIKA